MGTSHNLGQNFAKSFNISFLDKNAKKEFAYTTSWGTSTRLLGALVMAHSDNKGFVCPPKLAYNKAVIVPIIFEKTKDIVLKKANELKKTLSSFNPIVDEREECSAGWKFNQWELKGMPLRIEIGPKDIEKGQVVLVRRDTGEKKFVKESELATAVEAELEKMQKDLFEKANKFLQSNIVEASSWSDFKKAIEDRKIIHCHFCLSAECEKAIKEETTATSRCIPFEQKAPAGKCIKCGKAAGKKAYFGKAY